jgi:hypothetical protein
MNKKIDRQATSTHVHGVVKFATAALVVSLGSTALSTDASAFWRRGGYVYGAPYLYSAPVAYYGGPYGYYGGYGGYMGYYGPDAWMRRASRVIDGGAR